MAVLALLLARAGRAQEVGTIIELEGSADIGRSGTWLTASIGAAVSQGDVLRTGRPGRLQVVFHDESVITMSDDSQLAIDEQTIDVERGVARTVMRLLVGKIRALVGEQYNRPGSDFHIETPTAWVGVRGTDFVTTYDPAADASDAVSIRGRVEVHSVLDLAKHAVFITAREVTTVMRGQYPTAPRRLSEDLFRQYLEKLAFVGGGRPESLVAVLPVLTGASVPEPDRVVTVPAPSAPVSQPALAPSTGQATSAPADAVREMRDASHLIQQPPRVIETGPGKLGIHF